MMDNIRKELILVLKKQQWEKCKGELRAFIALEGSHKSTHDSDDWEKIEIAVKYFIDTIENEGLDE